MYFRVHVEAPNVTVTGVTINTVKLSTVGYDDIILLINTSPVEPGFTTSNFVFGEAGLDFADFQFYLNEDLLPPLAGGPRIFTTQIIADVSYIDNSQKKKRGGLNEMQISMTREFTVDTPKPKGGHGAAVTLLCDLKIVALTSFLLILISSLN
jgi:hypothetical protein